MVGFDFAKPRALGCPAQRGRRQLRQDRDVSANVTRTREQDRCYTSPVVISQLAYWVQTKEGGQRQPLQVWLTRLVDALHGRIHGFNVSVAHVWAEQERLLDKVGQRMPVEDGVIAATARRHRLTIATGNDRDFKRPGLKVFNPFKELA
jgi:toxin FitB